MFKTRITELLGIDYPILQGGMRWAARAELAAAVANAGGIGFMSAHTQPTPDDLAAEIARARALTSKSLGVNLTLLPANTGLDYDGYVSVIASSGITAVETAGGNPSRYIGRLKDAGVRVVHKCVTVKHALKAQSLGVDAVSIDGFECAGHPGEDDVPGLVLIPQAASKLDIPVVACGGFADGRGLVAALALGAEGINMGTRFMLTAESPLHAALKDRFVQATERDTVLIGRSYGDSSRVMRNSISERVLEIEKAGGATHHALLPLIGAKQWMQAMATGDVDGGAIPLGMSVGLANDLPTCEQLISRIVDEARQIIHARLPAMVPGG